MVIVGMPRGWGSCNYSDPHPSLKPFNSPKLGQNTRQEDSKDDNVLNMEVSANVETSRQYVYTDTDGTSWFFSLICGVQVIVILW